MKCWLVGVVAVACSSSKPPPVACNANELRTWLANVVADDQVPEQLDGLTLATLDAYATKSPDAIRVAIACKSDHCTDVAITSRGELYGPDLGEGAALLGNDVHGNDRVALLIDAHVPWHALAVIIGALGNAGVQHVALAFTAGKTHAAAPGRSSIDVQLAAADAKDEADLQRDPGGTLDRTIKRGPLPFIAAVYKDCPQAPKLIGDITSERVPSSSWPP